MRLALASALLLAVASTARAGDVYTVTDFDSVPAGSFSGPGAVNNPGVLGTPGAFEFNGNGFLNSYTPDWDYWEGWALSNQSEPVAVSNSDAYYMNQYYSAAGGAASGDNYAIAYSSQAPGFENLATIELAAGQKAYSIDVTNTWYTKNVLETGNSYGDAFAAGDYFTMTINGYADGVLTGSVEVVLADYRDGGSFILDSWTTVSLLDLGAASTLQFSFFSTDSSDILGPRTPTYVAVDDFTTYATTAAVPEPSSWALMGLGLSVVGVARRRRRRD